MHNCWGVLTLTGWGKKGKPKHNALVSLAQFEERMSIVGILYHEWVHDNYGEHGGIAEGADERRAYAMQKAYLTYILNNKELTADQKEVIRRLIARIDEIVKLDYGGW